MKKKLIIDTHAHLNFRAYENDVEDVIQRSLDNNIKVINVGSNYETSCKAVEIAENHKQGIYASIGFHPIHTIREFVKNKTDEEESRCREDFFDYQKYKNLFFSHKLKQPRLKIVAIGETGLDYYYKPKNKEKLSLFKEKQKNVFIEHLNLAQELNLPVIFHCRMAHQDLVEILKLRIKEFKLKGVVHCFTGSWEEAKQYLKIGLYIGFTGIIFKLNLEETIKNIPLDKILVETDCPYLIPPEVKDVSRNEPLFVKYVAREVARIKKMPVEEIIKITTQNAKHLFDL